MCRAQADESPTHRTAAHCPARRSAITNLFSARARPNSIYASCTHTPCPTAQRRRCTTNGSTARVRVDSGIVNSKSRARASLLSSVYDSWLVHAPSSYLILRTTLSRAPRPPSTPAHAQHRSSQHHQHPSTEQRRTCPANTNANRN